MLWDKVRYVSSFAKIIRCFDPYKFIMVHRGKERRKLLLSIFPCKLGSGKTRRKEDMKEEPTPYHGADSLKQIPVLFYFSSNLPDFNLQNRHGAHKLYWYTLICLLASTRFLASFPGLPASGFCAYCCCCPSICKCSKSFG